MSSDKPVAVAEQLRRVLVRWTIVLGAVGLFALWATWRMSNAASRLPATTTGPAAADKVAEPEIEYWTCTMHPQVRQGAPGECPQCPMELVPKYVGSDTPGVEPASGDAAHSMSSDRSGSQPWYRCTMPECGDQGSADPDSRCPVCGMKRERVEINVTLDARARRLAEIATEPVAERLLTRHIRTVGRVGYDETRYKMVSAWIGGRIDKLFADFTGMNVSQGDHLVEIYSPELLSAQEEYLQALRSVTSAPPAETEIARRSNEQILTAARRKLELLGVTDAQIAAIHSSGEPRTHLVVHAPIGGTILDKQAMEGKYVKTGDPLYTIADLHHLWLLVDLYESDLPWVKPFQQVRVTTRSLPGEVFTGQIMFVDPKVKPRTRTVEVRVHVDNPAMRLKPDMWVTARIDAELSRGGRGAVPAPEGEFACPMHTWETSNQRDACPVCGMDRVPVERLPHYVTPTEPVPLLTVPRSAVMQTGERALVYVESSPGVYRGVEVTIGPLAEGQDGRAYYAVLGGLSGGERVVTRGSFAIDSQMQLAGKPSLFSARGLGDSPRAGHDMPTPAESGDAMPAEHEAHGPSTQPAEAVNRQKTCPVMGGEIDPEVFIEYKGVKVYFCCWGCDDRFLADPDKYIPKLPPEIQKQIQDAESSGAASQPSPTTEPAGKSEVMEQKTCPVMGHEIDKEVYTDFHGVRIYFRCPPCIEKFKANPGKYLEKLPEVTAQRLRKAIGGEDGWPSY